MAKKKSALFLISHFVLIFLWILNGGSVYSVIQRNLLLVLLLAYVMFLYVIYGSMVRQALVNAFIFGIVIVTACILIDYSFSIQPQDGSKYLFVVIEFLIAGALCIYFFSVFTYEEFLRIFYKVLKFIRWHALISAVFISALPFLFTIHVTNDYNGYDAYSSMLVFFKLSKQFSFEILGFSLTRNQGLFWEPGVLQFYLNLFLFLQLYVFKAKPMSIMLTVVALITTYSTSAYLIMLLIASLAILQSIKRRPAIYFPLTALALLLYIPFLQANLENKFNGEEQNSSLARIMDVVQQAVVIESNFMTGVGIDDQRYAIIRSQYKVKGYYEDQTQTVTIDRGSTNSILFIWATMGFPIGCLWLYAYIKQPFVQHKKLLFSVLILLAVFVEPLLLKQFFVTFMMGGFMSMYYSLRYKKKGKLWLNALNSA